MRTIAGARTRGDQGDPGVRRRRALRRRTLPVDRTAERWASLTAAALPVADVGLGDEVVVAGYVSRVTVHPSREKETMVVSLTDGSGTVRISLPRDAVVMVRIGSRLAVNGLAHGDPTDGLRISPREAVAISKEGLPISVLST